MGGAQIMMMKIMNYFCCLVDLRKAFSFSIFPRKLLTSLFPLFDALSVEVA